MTRHLAKLALAGSLLAAALSLPAEEAAEATFEGTSEGTAEGMAEGMAWPAPQGLPLPPVPDDNPLTAAKVQLGEALFSDVRLSFNGTVSCATCHDPARDFADGEDRSVGADGRRHPRNTPTLWNVAYQVSFGWVEQGLHALEAQHLVPLLGKDPVEMGLDDAALARLNQDKTLQELARLAFADDELNAQRISQALASYVRTLLRADRPFDDWFLRDDRSGVSASARRGFDVFFSDAAGCAACHGGRAFGAPDVRTPYASAVSGSEEAFRVPSLRFAALTAPYMHDGSLATLADVIDFYASAPAGAQHRAELSAADRADLLAFLELL